MEKLPECYGTYGSAECGSCKWAEWCVTAADLPTMDESCRFREFAQNFEGFDAIDNREQSEGGDLSKILGELIMALDADRADLLWDFLSTMSALSKQNPSTYRVVRLRILHPQATYQELAELLGMTRQCVENHLQISVDLIPELKASMPLPRARLSRASDTFSLRCVGNNICVTAEGVSIIMRMPMDERNSKTALHVVRGLNNLHWRKRDALLDELK